MKQKAPQVNTGERPHKGDKHSAVRANRNVTSTEGRRAASRQSGPTEPQNTALGISQRKKHLQGPVSSCR